MSIPTLTLVHVIISLVAIASGLKVAWELLRGKPGSVWNSLFLATTVATSVTGFFFGSKFGPPHVIGLISLVLLAIAVYGLFGGLRVTYIVTALASLYLNVFVGLVQAFQKIPFLKALAPTQSEPPFAVAQGVALLAFVVVGWLAVKRSRGTHHAGPAAA